MCLVFCGARKHISWMQDARYDAHTEWIHYCHPICHPLTDVTTVRWRDRGTCDRRGREGEGEEASASVISQPEEEECGGGGGGGGGQTIGAASCIRGNPSLHLKGIIF